jgi:hypothetical protein
MWQKKKEKKNNAKNEKLMSSKAIIDMLLKNKGNRSENWTRIAHTLGQQTPN